MRDLIYDIETYPNLFSICFLDTQTQKMRMFEMSDWRNDWDDFQKFTKKCSNGFVRWVGFNNYYFDYQVIHDMLKMFKMGSAWHTGDEIARAAHKKANDLIRSSKDERFTNITWDNNHIVPQIDLYRIHHFDNVARATSLKVLEFNMRSETIEDLPFDYTKPLTAEQRPILLKYNEHDVSETYKFYLKTLHMIRFREELSEKYGKNFLNFNDTKIGKEYFIMELENSGVKCFSLDEDGRKPIQTKRDRIKISDIIFPYINFKRPEFNAVLKWLRAQEITQTKGVFTDLTNFDEIIDYVNHEHILLKIRNSKGNIQSKYLRTVKMPEGVSTIHDKIAHAKSKLDVVSIQLDHLHVVIDGMQFDFGTGGIHGSIDSTIVEEDANYALIDYDVTSLYPSIGIVNGVFPKHLTKKFCSVYAQLKKDRVSYAKGTPENAMLKLALNGVYGDSNNTFSPFFDPQYTMTITINGQLSLCMLAEMYMQVESAKIIQINTDGVTVKVRRDKIEEIEAINKLWSDITLLDLERADYCQFFVRDVNNYLGVYINGKVKAKGAYKWDSLYRPDHPDPNSIEWHKNHSAVVIQMAVNAYLTEGKDIREFIEQHDDPFDFMLRTKVPRTSRLMWGDEQIQNTSRYYMSKNGRQLTKIMPPLAKSPEKERAIKVNDGWKVTPINNMREVDDIDPTWYIEEALKLVQPLYQGYINEMMEFS